MKSAKGLGFLLGFSLETLEEVANTTSRYYFPFEKVSYKRNGKIKVRLIEPSKGLLNKIQVRIKDRILTDLIEKNELSKYLYGGIKGKCNIENARVHQGKKYHFCTDLKNFFPSISNAAVYEMFMDHGFSSYNSRLLTKLTTLNNHLPQGTPTSTHISNLVFLKVDRDLVARIEKLGLVYTRFVDDLTFSGESDFKYITFELLEIIKSHHFLFSHSKTFYSDRPVEVTGIIVKQNGLDVNDKFKSKDLSKSTSQARKAHFDYQNRVVGTSSSFHPTLNLKQQTT
jgi:RNA-directed DNA polymerase